MFLCSFLWKGTHSAFGVRVLRSPVRGDECPNHESAVFLAGPDQLSNRGQAALVIEFSL